MIIESAFKPDWRLSNRHLQTIWPQFNRPQLNIPYEIKQLDLPDGDFVDIYWCELTGQSFNPRQPVVIFMHGIGGNFNSHYVPSMIQSLQSHGFRVAFLHARGCSGRPNRLPATFHAADTSELSHLVQTIRARYPNAPIAALGMSLGGSILLKWLSENSDKNPLSAAVAISVPFDLSGTADALNKGFARVYQQFILKRLKSVATIKATRFELPVPLQDVLRISTIRRYDDLVTARANGFGNVDHYYRVASCRQYLGAINTPTLIINAKDDPFVPSHCLPGTSEISSCITLELSRQGGHAGFIQDKHASRLRYCETRVPRFMNDHLL